MCPNFQVNFQVFIILWELSMGPSICTRPLWYIILLLYIFPGKILSPRSPRPPLFYQLSNCTPQVNLHSTPRHNSNLISPEPDEPPCSDGSLSSTVFELSPSFPDRSPGLSPPCHSLSPSHQGSPSQLSPSHLSPQIPLLQIPQSSNDSSATSGMDSTGLFCFTLNVSSVRR